MRRRAAAVGLAMATFFGSAQAPLTQATPTTLLHLSASSSIQAAPDQLATALMAQSTSSSAAEAQRSVNMLMAEGLRAARSLSGMEVRAVGYAVTPANDKRTAWVAQQTLELRSADGPALLDLAGRLQAKGFAMTSLDWQLSLGLRRKTYDEATTAALKELQMRAAAAATALGLQIDHLQDVRLEGLVSQPRRPPSISAMAVRAAPPPQATAVPEEVTAEVSADVVLRP
jgi:uncharacterized protein